MDWYTSLKNMIKTGRYPSYDAMMGRITTFAGEGKITMEQAEELKALLDAREGK